MRVKTLLAAVAAASLACAAAACTSEGAANSSAATARTIPVTVTTAAGTRHVFNVEVARTSAEQERGLMYRTDIGKDGGMIFIPYPADGGPPREASFWMKNTPTSLDIIFIRPDGTIATIAENTVPFSESSVPSGEPVSAVLEILGGRSAELGIAGGDRVTWKP
jgi:uncharacterized protein